MFDRKETTLAFSPQEETCGPGRAGVRRARAAGPPQRQSGAPTGAAGEIHALRTEIADLATRLAEAHHRARNNLQLVANMLILEAVRLEAPAQAVLQLLADRVVAIGFIHHQLDAAPEPTRMALGTALQALCRRIDEAYGGLAEITADVGDDPCEIDTLTAMRLSLLANEVITNALKHAFPDGRRGRITLRLRSAGPQRLLSIVDDGVGYNPTAAYGTGAKLIRMLGESAGGMMQYQTGCEGGTRFALTF